MRLRREGELIHLIVDLEVGMDVAVVVVELLHEWVRRDERSQDVEVLNRLKERQAVENQYIAALLAVVPYAVVVEQVGLRVPEALVQDEDGVLVYLLEPGEHHTVHDGLMERHLPRSLDMRVLSGDVQLPPGQAVAVKRFPDVVAAYKCFFNHFAFSLLFIFDTFSFTSSSRPVLRSRLREIMSSMPTEEQYTVW